MVIIIQSILLIIIGILLFALIIFIHEFGHFITAKKSGVRVNEFAIGMGPKILGFVKGETQYTLRLLPIGGYCAMEGEDSESSDPNAFYNAKVWKRMIIVIAGAVMNILLGFVLMLIVLVQEPYFSSTTVESFPELSFSANCGLKVNDKILKINDTSIVSARDISYAIQTSELKTVDGTTLQIYKEDCSVELYKTFAANVNEKYKKYSDIPSEVTDTLNNYISKINTSTTKDEAKIYYNQGCIEIADLLGNTTVDIAGIETQSERQRYNADLLVLRDGEKIELKNVDFYTYYADDEKINVAIDFYVSPIDKTPITVVTQTFKETVSTVKTIWSSLIGMLQGKFGMNDISGPIGATSAIVQVTSQGLQNSFVDGLNNLIFMMMVITVNLGIVNMLPFPALDGGRFVLLLIEAIFKKSLPQKYEGFINAAGLIILLLFMVIISFKDVFKIIGGSNGF